MPILRDLLSPASGASGITVNPNIQMPSTSGGTSSFNSGLAGNLDPNTFIFNASVILEWALGIIAVLTFFYAGFKYITAGGDAEKAESAKKIMIGSLIGLVIVLGAYVIFNNAADILTSPTPMDQKQIQDQLQKTY